ncbi:hypothetical protein [Undibacterium sp.]|uniref:hypothetical protein n=1 Tax=Undibacterium sp. TaxID=1914977 RepID=UPI00375007E2
MHIIIPIKITESMIGSGTSIAEPAAGETVWVSGGSYALGALRIRIETHREYECVQAHSGRTEAPEDDPAYWLDKNPTQRHAPFDAYKSTAAKATGALTYVLSPGYFNVLALYGMTGLSLTVTLRPEPGGTPIHNQTYDLLEPPIGDYEYLFSPPKYIKKIIVKDLPIRPSAQLTLTLTSSSGEPVSIGMINVGDYSPLYGDGEWGGTRYGCSAEPVSNSYVDTNPDGTFEIKKRLSATGMRAVVELPLNQANQALEKLQSVLDEPVSYIASDLPDYAGLNVFGLGKSYVTYDGEGGATINISVQGFI